MKRWVLIILLGALATGFSAGLSFAQEGSTEYKEYVIKTQGQGKTVVEPDAFRLNFLVESESISLRRATKDNAKKVGGIIEKIKKLGVPNLEFSTSTFDFVGQKGRGFILPGKKYKVSNTVTVKAKGLEYDKISDYASSVVDTAIQNGATRVRGLAFYLDDEKAAQDSALEAALENARGKAALVAKGLGVSLKEPYNVLGFWFSGSSRPRMPMYDYRMSVVSEQAADSRAQVVAGKETVTANIELEYKFK